MKIIQGVVGVHEWIYSTYCVISSLIIHTYTLSYFTLCGRFHFIHQAFITLRRIIYFELLVRVYWKYLHILNLLIYISKLIKSSLKQNSIISSFIVYKFYQNFHAIFACMHIDFLLIITWNSNIIFFFKLQDCSKLL